MTARPCGLIFGWGKTPDRVSLGFTDREVRVRVNLGVRVYFPWVLEK